MAEVGTDVTETTAAVVYMIGYLVQVHLSACLSVLHSLHAVSQEYCWCAIHWMHTYLSGTGNIAVGTLDRQTGHCLVRAYARVMSRFMYIYQPASTNKQIHCMSKSKLSAGKYTVHSSHSLLPSSIAFCQFAQPDCSSVCLSVPLSVCRTINWLVHIHVPGVAIVYCIAGKFGRH